jgi:hypothetical protein
MVEDDEAARKERAAALRERIARLKPNQTQPVDGLEGDSETDDEQARTGEENPAGESPRELIQRRMRELDNKT